MPKNIWLLIIGMAINVTASSFIWPLNTIYMHQELGESLTFAGMILLLNQGAAIAGNLIGGSLFDRIGGYKTVLSGGAITFVSTVILTQFHTLVPYSILLITMGFGSGIIVPAMFAMAASVWPEGGRRTFNAIYVAQNLGVALGAALGGFIAEISFSYIFYANALLFAIYYFIVIIFYKRMDEKHDSRSYTTVLSQGLGIKNKRSFIALLILSSAFFVCWVTYVQWQTTIASHTQAIGISLNRYSLIWTVNGVLIVLGQPLIKLFTKFIKNPRTHIVIGNSIFIVSFLYLLTAETFAHFVTGMIILTIGEMLVWPAVPTIASDLAPEGRQGFYQGFINSVGTAGRMIGPVFGGMIADRFPIDVLFITLVFLLILPFISIWILKVFQRKEIIEQTSN